MIRRILAGSRYLIAIAAAGIFVAATALLIYGAAQTYALVASVFQGSLSLRTTL